MCWGKVYIITIFIVELNTAWQKLFCYNISYPPSIYNRRKRTAIAYKTGKFCSIGINVLIEASGWSAISTIDLNDWRKEEDT